MSKAQNDSEKEQYANALKELNKQKNGQLLLFQKAKSKILAFGKC